MRTNRRKLQCPPVSHQAPGMDQLLHLKSTCILVRLLFDWRAKSKHRCKMYYEINSSGFCCVNGTCKCRIFHWRELFVPPSVRFWWPQFWFFQLSPEVHAEKTSVAISKFEIGGRRFDTLARRRSSKRLHRRIRFGKNIRERRWGHGSQQRSDQVRQR